MMVGVQTEPSFIVCGDRASTVQNVRVYSDTAILCQRGRHGSYGRRDLPELTRHDEWERTCMQL